MWKYQPPRIDLKKLMYGSSPQGPQIEIGLTITHDIGRS
jgi:hypothetical protein